MTEPTELQACIAAPPTFAGAVEGATVEAIATLAKEASEPKLLLIPTKGLTPGLPENVPVLWDRGTQKPIEVMDIVEAARPPLVRKGTAKVETLQSFIDLANRHKDENSAIFAATGWPNPSLTAVIDYHTSGHEARRGEHKVRYDFPLTEEFRVWVDKSGKEMSQVDFAQFLENHAAELSAPMDGEVSEYERLFKARFATPNELIDLSRHLEVYEGAKVTQGVRLASGERQVIFTTEHTNAAGEPIDIPGIFMVQVPPFIDGDTMRIPARIRYRLKGGAITWFYDLYRWRFWLRDRVQIDLLRASKDTSLPAYEGTPEMAA